MSGFRGRRSQAQSPRGLFENGTWLCDCNPRVPAIHFQVKKVGPNKGRWFYTCQKQKDDPTCCKLFLWDDDAKPREERALLSNNRTEPGRAVETPSKPQRHTPPPPYTPSQPTTGTKRKQSSDEDDEYGSRSNDSFQDALAQAARAEEAPRASKMARIDPNTTPARRKLPWVEDGQTLPTPRTDSRTLGAPTLGDSLLTPSKTSSRTGTSFSSNLFSPNVTPTPARFRDALSGDGDGLAKEVFDLLQERRVNLDADTQAVLKQVLGKHSLRYQGVVRGRDVARLAIKAKEAKITELQHHITTLEAELEVERGLVQNLQWKAETGHQSDS